MKDRTLVAGKKVFELDDLGCLKDFHTWSPEFAEAMTEEVGHKAPLTERHFQIISYLRETIVRTGHTPCVHRTCRDNNLSVKVLAKMFPAGYHRGACKLAGLNYYDQYTTTDVPLNKTYTLNGRGFLVDPSEWDESFALTRSEELGVDLTGRHWDFIHYLRKSQKATGKVPTVHEACLAFDLEVDDLERLFPTGYHRGALKIAGLNPAL